MEQNIKISIIIPTYKTSFDTLNRAVSAVLMQVYTPFEVIVVDDNGDNEYRENSRRVATKYGSRIRLLLNDVNMGANYTRNRGVISAKGDFIAFLDSDDEWSDDYLMQVVATIKKNKAKFVTTNYQVVHEDGILPPVFDEKNFVSGDIYKKELVQDRVGPTSTIVIAKDVIVDAGLFDEALPARQDYDMWLRVTKLVPVYYNYKPCVKIFRMGGDSISSSYERNIRGTKMVLDKILSSNDLTKKERKEILAAHYKSMALACILCNAYAESRVYAKKSLYYIFEVELLIWFVLSYSPLLFTSIRNLRKRYYYNREKK